MSAAKAPRRQRPVGKLETRVATNVERLGYALKAIQAGRYTTARSWLRCVELSARDIAAELGS